MKRKKPLLLILAIILLLQAACSDKKETKVENENLENLNKADMPIVDDPISLNIFAGHTPTTAEDWNDVLILNTYEDMTNIDIKWNQVPIDGMSEKRNLALASGDLPDAFYASYIPTSDLLKYGEQGTFIKLNDLIDKYAPHLKKIFEENPDIEKGVTFPDGNIYSLPTIYSPDFLSNLIGAKPWINQKWLKQLGMENPETIDELYKYLKAVKATDLNGNGKNDEIPLGSVSMNRIIHWIGGAFGIGNKGNILHQNIDMDPETDELRFFPIEDEYKEMLQYLNKLYSEGLIEQNIYTLEVEQYLANGASELYGATQFFNPIELFGKEVGEKYIGGKALKGPHGDQLYVGVTSPVFQMGNFAITSENDNPAATVRWLDYFYSDEGAKLFNMGIEGKTYEETEDGPKLLDKITNSSEGLTTTQELAKYLISPGGGHPGIIKQNYFTGSEASPGDLAVAEELKPYIPEEIWPSFTYTLEENKKMKSFNDITKYVTEMQAKFITGDTSFSKWEDYVKTIKDIGLEDYMKIQQAAYERYLEH